MMATGASTAIASDSPALKDGEAPREPELPFQEVVTCRCSRHVAEVPPWDHLRLSRHCCGNSHNVATIASRVTPLWFDTARRIELNVPIRRAS